MTALDALGYAVGEPAAKGGPVLYRAAFIVVFTLLTLIRIWFRVATGAFRERLYADREEWRFIALRGVFGIPLAAATAVFVFRLPWAPWSFVCTARTGLRWLGAGLAFAAVVLVAVVHRALGGSFSPTIPRCTRARRRLADMHGAWGVSAMPARALTAGACRAREVGEHAVRGDSITR